MFKLFCALAVFLCANVMPLSALASSCEQTQVVVIPSDPASQVVFGPEMPRDGCYLMAIKSGLEKTPTSDKEAVADIKAALPNWLYVAVGLSAGENECVVMVNDTDYFRIAVAAMVSQWRKRSSVELPFLRRVGGEWDEAVDGLQGKVCKAIKFEMPRSTKYTGKT
jgi:hypothetical protein